MTFLIGRATDTNFPDDTLKRWSDYFAHLEAIKAALPDAVRDFFLADWHYNSEDPRCLHDAWLEELAIQEHPRFGGSSARLVTARMCLLGWNHDRRLVVDYIGVQRYSISRPSESPNAPTLSGHGDLLYDEVEIAQSGRPVHHLEFSSGSLVRLEFETMKWRWAT